MGELRILTAALNSDRGRASGAEKAFRWLPPQCQHFRLLGRSFETAASDRRLVTSVALGLQITGQRDTFIQTLRKLLSRFFPELSSQSPQGETVYLFLDLVGGVGRHDYRSPVRAFVCVPR